MTKADARLKRMKLLDIVNVFNIAESSHDLDLLLRCICFDTLPRSYDTDLFVHYVNKAFSSLKRRIEQTAT